jgi:hypothetical protein
MSKLNCSVGKKATTVILFSTFIDNSLSVSFDELAPTVGKSPHDDYTVLIVIHFKPTEPVA